VIAAYRIDHDQWENTRALKEAMSCGMARFQIPRQNFIRNFHPLPAIESAQTSPANNQKEPTTLQPVGIPPTPVTASPAPPSASAHP
jgi:hypothetical protein